MSILFLFLLANFTLSAKEYNVETVPNARLSDRFNHISNPDGIINAEDVIHINQLLQFVEDSLGIEVAVVAIESIGDNDAREFATDLFNHWGLGKKGMDNGLLIQLVTEPSQRSVVFETGYGLEGILPDAICNRLQQHYMIPDLKAGNYSKGMLKGVEALKDYLMSSDYEQGMTTGNQQEGDDDILFYLVLFLFPFMTIMLLLFTKRRPRKCPNCGKKTLVYAGSKVIQRATYASEGLTEDLYICKNCGYKDNKKYKTSRIRHVGGPIIGGGRGFGGGSGGSFGGGSWGGGRSGGGGSISRF